MKLSADWIRDFVEISVDDRRLAEDLTNVGIGVEGIIGTGADTVFEVEIGTNRPDAMNHYGVSREAAAVYGVELKALAAFGSSAAAEAADSRGADDAALKRRSSTVALAARGSELPLLAKEARSGAPQTEHPPKTQQAAGFPITVEEPGLCPRFSARVIRGTRIVASPRKIAHRLALLDQRAISNAVDATNYVLWEMGKPTHVFDMDLLEGGRIVVRKARDGETLRTLDGVERKLSSEDLVVCDARKPVGLAGVMGGYDTMITEKTRNIVIESAWWDPGIVRRMSRRHGIHTDASHRFERGADFESTVVSCDLVARMILESGGGGLVGDVVDVVSRPMDQAPVVLRLSEVRRILGEGLDSGEIFQLLKRLGFTLVPEGQGGTQDEAQFRVHIPSWRLDVEREIDVIEEIARLHGYDKFENTLPAYSGAVVELPHAAMDAAFRARALALGYNEAMSLTFISHADAERFESCASFPSAAKAAAPLATGERSAEALRHPKSGSASAAKAAGKSAEMARLKSGPSRSVAGSELGASGFESGASRFAGGSGSGAFRSAAGLEAGASQLMRVLELENPLSEEASVMRTSLAPGMLDMLAWNLNRDVAEARLFEMGSVYGVADGSEDAHVEPRRACLGATAAAVRAALPVGNALDVSKDERAAAAEIFRGFKGDVENLLAAFSGEASYDRETAEYFHPGRSARVLVNGALVGQFGQIHPEVAAARKLRQDVFLAEFDLEALYGLGLRPVKFTPLGKYPAVERDFSFVFEDGIAFEKMRRAVVNLGIEELREFRPVEIFRGGTVAAAKYSVLLRVRFQSAERTLREDEVAQWSGKIVGALAGLGGAQRA
jgi:phenylalanyl-tRNA synthetase beta subunit